MDAVIFVSAAKVDKFLTLPNNSLGGCTQPQYETLCTPNNLNYMGTTGTICEVSGVYYCKSHPSQTIPLAKGNRFPPCATTGHGTTWILKYKA